MAKGLTPKQERFAQLYVELGNASEAYKQAGYAGGTSRTVEVNASRLLRNAEVSQRIDQLGQEAAAVHAITAERVMEELGKIGFASMREFVRIMEDGSVRLDWKRASESHAIDAISEITQDERWETDADSEGDLIPVRVVRTRFKLHDKQRALELIGKRLRMWVQLVEDVTPVDEERLPALTADQAKKINDEIEELLH